MKEYKLSWEKIYTKKFIKNISLSWENEIDENIEKFLDYVKNIIPNFTKLKLIEVGIGTGVNIILYFSKGFKCVYGIEISSIAIKFLKSKFKNVIVFKKDMCDKYFSIDKKFDIIIEGGVLHTLLPQYWDIYLQNLRKLFSLHGIGYMRVFMSKEKDYEKIGYLENTDILLWGISKVYLYNLLNRNGFKIINFYEDKEYFDGIYVLWFKLK